MARPQSARWKTGALAITPPDNDAASLTEEQRQARAAEST
jgi:hypothetical protein